MLPIQQLTYPTLPVPASDQSIPTYPTFGSSPNGPHPYYLPTFWLVKGDQSIQPYQPMYPTFISSENVSNPLHLINLWLIVRCVHSNSNQSHSVELTHNYPLVPNQFHLSNVPLTARCDKSTQPIEPTHDELSDWDQSIFHLWSNSNDNPFICPTYSTLGSSSKNPSTSPLQPFSWMHDE